MRESVFSFHFCVFSYSERRLISDRAPEGSALACLCQNAVTADFVEDRPETADRSVVHNTVAGEQPVMVLNIRRVVPYRVAENIGQFTAGFFQDDLRTACVPEFGSRRRMDVEVADLFGDQTDLEADRAPLHFAGEAEIRSYLRGYLAAMISRSSDVHFAIICSL